MTNANDETSYTTCPECAGLKICPHCEGRARETGETCECWWWDRRGFDLALMGRCGECAGSGVIAVPKNAKA